MQFLVLLVVGRSRVTTATIGQLDPVHELHVRTIVQLVGVTRSGIPDQESERSTLLESHRLAVDRKDENSLAPDGLQWHAGRKIVGSGVQCQVTGSEVGMTRESNDSSVTPSPLRVG